MLGSHDAQHPSDHLMREVASTFAAGTAPRCLAGELSI